MRTPLLASLAAIALAAPAGCSKSDPPKASAAAAAESGPKVPEITIAELEQKLASGECQAVDANGAGTRKKLGVIPGAILLSDYEAFRTSELPTDKARGLVFYCANEHCGASSDAAARAITAGYTNVKVLPDGIAGWVKAGKKTDQI